MTMHWRTGWWRLLATLVVLVAMVAWSRYFLALSGERFRWERLCTMVCPPYEVSQHARDANRRASDWEKPLVLALAPWGCGLVVGVRRRALTARCTTPRGGRGTAASTRA